MKLTIPIYVESQTPQAGKGAEYVVSPLFAPRWRGKSALLQNAINELVRDVREQLVGVGKQLRHEALAQWTFRPEVETERCEVRLEVGRDVATIKLLVAKWRVLDRVIAFSPSVPDVWFEVLPDDSVAARLTEVLEEHLRRKDWERPDRMNGSHDDSVMQLDDLERVSLTGPAWVTDVEISLKPPRVREKPKMNLFAFLGSQETMDGEDELHKVGRCLNHLYPDDLDRVVLRDREVDDLTRLLRGGDKRPVLLLGPRQVGKTAIIHEYVFRQVEPHKNPHRDKEAVWLLSPQRLISGMSYVGQWESRLHAILKHASGHDLVLYFDDVLGLFQAGVSSQSSLNVAAVLKPLIERREVRVLAEMTPEAFRVFRERDRGLADLFDVIPVHEPIGDDNLRILIGTQRQLEARYRCRFGIEALPTVIDLQRRYARDTAFPGKAAGFLRRLAVKRGDANVADDANWPISRDDVIEAFHAQSGLPRSFLDQRVTLKPDDIRTKLTERFVGQTEAVQAAVEIIGIAKSRLNDADRPLASLLLLGPTGVGKTQFAKSLAAYLFGQADRLLRFDMNEYVSPNSVPQLVGTFAQPEGLLTSAVRRQPFSVVLFDEIEKGHPDVFDLLLQVLGEGRLTDALGRTADFSNTIIVLTSNLGATRSATGLGFGSRDENLQRATVRAAEEFFRPEFFNRLDRVIPFDRISRDDMQHIARLLIDEVLRREGLTRRRSVLDIAPAAVDWVIDQGYDPVLGARALKRTIERELARLIAWHLAERPLPADAETRGLTIIRVDRVADGMQVTLRDIPPVNIAAGSFGAFDAADHELVVKQSRAVLDRMRAELPHIRPTGSVISSKPTPWQTRYLTTVEWLEKLDEFWSQVHQSLNPFGSRAPRSEPQVSRPRPPEGPDRTRRRRGPSRRDLAEYEAANDELDEVTSGQNIAGQVKPIDIPNALLWLVANLTWLQSLMRAADDELDQTVNLRLRLFGRCWDSDLARMVSELLFVKRDQDLDVEAPDEIPPCIQELTWTVSGPIAVSTARGDVGFYQLPVRDDSTTITLEVSANELTADTVHDLTTRRMYWHLPLPEEFR